mgnify:FL=1
MYDKVKLWLPMMSDTPDLTAHLERAKVQTDLATGEVSAVGYLGGLKVMAYGGGYSIIGSLAKFMFGSNVFTLDRRTTAQAIEKLADALQYDCTLAKVTGLEFGTHFQMRKPVVEYLKKLGEMPRLLRYHFDAGTLYYKPRAKTPNKVFCFYDKNADAQAKGVLLPSGFEDANLLRYEMRLNSRLPAQTGFPFVDVAMLTNLDFYRALIKMWQASYFSISRQQQIKNNLMNDIKTVKDAFNVLVAQLISRSDKDQILSFVDELKQAGVFEDRKNYTRLKKKILDVSKMADCPIVDDDIRELDEGVQNAGAYV